MLQGEKVNNGQTFQSNNKVPNKYLKWQEKKVSLPNYSFGVCKGYNAYISKIGDIHWASIHQNYRNGDIHFF